MYASARWRRMSAAYLLRHPLCEQCMQRGLTVPAVDVHHRVSFTAFDGMQMLAVAYNPDNLVALCKECHTKIHLHAKEKDAV
ncbi:HNH endonuclease [Prevotella sp. KH2C16]|uniref:HNH endonuclease n=1 Tax=Prevotella sp. KH2C16 TaxID=1855325 RepID=UPI0015A5DF0F|nr:HNH endonuclease signature motif containing protein [Prevotella sp. KH2C16]